MTEHSIASWLVLNRAPGIGPTGYRLLLETFSAAREVVEADNTILEKFGLSLKTLQYLKTPDWETIENDINWLEHPDHHLVTLKDDNYPPLLKAIDDAPLLLFVHGDPTLLHSIQLAVVGSRNPSTGGMQTAREFSGQLAQCGMTVTSGMAVGIDYNSHVGVMSVNGKTIAILGNGPDIIYPAQYKELASQIVEYGALVSEFPPGTKPLPGNFPRRNRIISGLSTGILLIEAAKRSGSLITARCGIEQGREVFAIPGSIHNPLAKGCHSMIKQGAKLVETTQDIIEELGPLIYVSLSPDSSQGKTDNAIDLLDEDYTLLLEKIAYESISVDKLIERTGLTADKVSSMLLVLELQGLVSSSPGGLYERTN